MELLLAYAAGMLTLINPCVLPVLPIVLASALNASRLGPVLLTAGMSASFVAVGMFLALLGPSLGLNDAVVSRIGAGLMIGFGAVLLIPRAGAAFATATAGLAARADARMDRLDAGTARGQLLGGALLGAVWSPCVGPTLGAAIAMAATGESPARAAAIMTAFALGLSTVMLALAYGTRRAIAARAGAMRALAGRARPILGAAFLGVGLMLWFHLNRIAEAWLLDHMPAWLIDFSVSI